MALDGVTHYGRTGKKKKRSKRGLRPSFSGTPGGCLPPMAAGAA